MCIPGAAGWGVPLVGLAFLLGFEKIGYENTFPVCQVYLDEDPSWWDWAFFFGPSAHHHSIKYCWREDAGLTLEMCWA
jgi:hypothetical protein